MTIWSLIRVPYAESHIAKAAGAEWSRLDRSWMCNATQWRSSAFRRWHSRASWRRVTIHVADGPRERAAAKERRCLFCPNSKTWYVDITEDASLTGWHRARLQPPTEYAIRVDYAEREKAKAAGCRWNPDAKTWVFACHGAPPGFVTRRRLDQPATAAASTAAAAA